MGYAARPETLLTPEYECRGSQRVKVHSVFIQRSNVSNMTLSNKIYVYIDVNLQFPYIYLESEPTKCII